MKAGGTETERKQLKKKESARERMNGRAKK